MSSLKEHVDTWYKYIKSNTKPEYEDPEIEAGRRTEDLLNNIVDNHYQFKGSHSFSGKRVYNDLLGHKNEIDLIVVSDKKLYVLECKNWSGRLTKRGDKWIQIKNRKNKQYSEIEHDDVVLKNNEKLKALLRYLNSKGLDVKFSDCAQKTILMNKNLAIDSEEIYNSNAVIPPDKLDTYLGKQKNSLAPHQRFFASIINIILDEESSGKVIDGLFKRIGGHQHKQLIHEINTLPTWDKVVLYGTKVLSGDVIKSDKNIFKSAYKVPFDRTQKIKIRILRSKSLFLVKSVLNIGRPIGLDFGRNFLMLIFSPLQTEGIRKIFREYLEKYPELNAESLGWEGDFEQQKRFEVIVKISL